MLQKLTGNARLMRIYGSTVGTSAVTTTAVPCTAGRWALFIITPNTTWGANITMTATLHDSADDSTYAAVSPSVATSITTAQAATSTGARSILVDMHRLRGYAKLSMIQNNAGNANTTVSVILTDYVAETLTNLPGVIASTGDGVSYGDTESVPVP